MALIPYAVARPFLFALDPETAHTLTLDALAHSTPLRWAYANTRVDDPFELAGLTFPNRVGLAAGLDKNARCIDGLGAMGFGFIEVGTVTPLEQAGNPRPRLFRLPKAQAIINRFGFNNEGLIPFIANLKRSAHYQRSQGDAPSALPMLLGLNIGKNATTPMKDAAQDYLTCLEAVYPYADYITVNISSPNTNNLRQLQNDDALDALLSVMSKRREVLSRRHGKLTPVFLKIAPDLNETQVNAMAQTLKRYGQNSQGQVNNAWGVVATNTTISRDAVEGMPHAHEAGGLSGAPLLHVSNQVITQLRSALGPQFPIMGVGGIMSAEDAVSKIRAGADVVQLYTGLIYQGPDLVRQSAMMIKKIG